MTPPARLDEIKAQVEELKGWLAQKDHSLAAEAALAMSRPFPDQLRPSQGCDCVFGPRCESNHCCTDENQTVGVKCQRTGEIRKRARWSLYHPWWSRGTAPRIVFYCNDCLEELRAVWGKPIASITPPPHASDFWRPSITEMVRHSAMEINRQKAAKQPPANYTEAVIASEMGRMRHRYTPAQCSQAEFVRGQMRR